MGGRELRKTDEGSRTKNDDRKAISGDARTELSVTDECLESFGHRRETLRYPKPCRSDGTSSPACRPWASSTGALVTNVGRDEGCGLAPGGAFSFGPFQSSCALTPTSFRLRHALAI